MPNFDYVIVGAGSAGCVLAARLSEQPDLRVLLLEAGPGDLTWKVRMPAALAYNLRDDRYNWFYHTEPQRFLDGRSLYWPRGRVLGGSSAHNAMVYVRGHRLDFERWAEEGAEGWSYADVLPYFRRLERCTRGADAWRGSDGPLAVWTPEQPGPLHEAFLEAGPQAGYPATADINGAEQEGFGRYDLTIDAGRRASTAHAYLRPVQRRPNLIVVTRALATKIVVEAGRAVAVDYVENGVARRVHADREIILSGGAINSPQLLMLSGVGPADHLREIGIPVVHDLPGVGENLQDHLEVYVQHACTRPITLYDAQTPLGMLNTGLEWFAMRTGPGASSHLETGAFVKSRADVAHPDIQLHFLPSLVIDHGRIPPDRHGFQVHAGTMRPTSRGRLRLRSADPSMHPLLEPDYLATEEDRVDMRAAVRIAREVFAQPAFDSFRGEELRPGPVVRTDADIDGFIRAMSDSAYHPSCTCRMGTDDMAVVDPEGRVRGLEGLRVVDASIMPSMTSGNLNAPTIMMAEKLADAVLGRPPLPPHDPGRATGI